MINGGKNGYFLREKKNRPKFFPLFASHSFTTSMHRSITEFMTIVPAKSEISIITFSKNAVMHLPPTVITDTNRNGIIGR